jgi:hypothetical protein
MLGLLMVVSWFFGCCLEVVLVGGCECGSMHEIWGGREREGLAGISAWRQYGPRRANVPLPSSRELQRVHIFQLPLIVFKEIIKPTVA